MLYKPNFCSNCGEKIERVDWNLLTSRRFCPACSIENRRHDLIPRMAVAAGALALVFGFGSLWGGSGSSAGSSSSLPATLKSEVPAQEAHVPGSSMRTASEPIPGEIPPTSKAEAVGDTGVDRKPTEAGFFCGALTKKGTPCSRKVKSKGIRCFQHEGRPAAASIN